MTTPTLDRFDPGTPIEPGVTVLEASAGTGKTHAVTSIVVDEIAAGRPVDELLIVTFTIKATGTLRERVWKRLREAAVDPARSPIERDRLDAAVADFDRASIATIHGFCRQMLGGLGVAGDGHRELELVEDVRELVHDVVDDLFVRRFHDGNELLFSRGVAARIARAVVDNPSARIGPYDSASPEAALRARFATTVRRQVEERKRAMRLLTFDDVLLRLASSVDEHAGERGGIAVERLRQRFSLVVVDEFQDTDATQWKIFERAFGSDASRLVLVGDPKQSIYAFRGGDVHAYLDAVRRADHVYGLDQSWRADGTLLRALDALFDGAELGGPGVRHRPLTPRPGAELPRLRGPAVGAPLTFRMVDRAAHGLRGNRHGAYVDGARDAVATDVAAVAVSLLDPTTTSFERDRDGAEIEGSARPLEPADIAVLVRTNRDAEQIRTALHAAGIPAVVHGTASVLTSPSARDWHQLLHSLDRPAMSSRIRAVALGPFVGWDAARLASAGDADWDQVEELVHEWSVSLRRHGVAGLLRRIEAGTGLTERVLSTVGGERQLSDLRHVAELLHAEHAEHPSSPGALGRWLADRMAEARASDDGRRRLESDAKAVTVQTIHGAKGLEFPVVLLPSLYESGWAPDDELPVYHDGGERWIGVGGVGPLHEEHRRLAQAERDGEELRLAYVALTRARHEVVAWWCTTTKSKASPLARLLLGREPGGSIAREVAELPSEDAVRAAVSVLTMTSGGQVELVEAPPGPSPRWSPRVAAAPRLDMARWGRQFDEAWTRTSYSALTAAAHEAPGPPVLVALERVDVEERATVDEPVDAEDAGPVAVGASAGAGAGADVEPVPLGELPGGARFGTLVHDVLEHTDFRAPDLGVELAAAVDAAGAERLVGGGAMPALVSGLAVALSTPLGSLLGGRALRELDRADRLDELAFDLPLAGGDRPAGDAVVTMPAIADVFERFVGAGDPLAGYHERLRDEVLDARVRGFLSGSIDLVARAGDRYVVIDYKTNHLGVLGEPVLATHYSPEAMAAAMIAADYPLQAALYAVALHRYLRWRLPGYDPERHLGGIGYLFLRGMTGEPGAGVLAWHPPAAFVEALSDLLDTGVVP